MRWLVIALLAVMVISNLIIVLDADRRTALDRAGSLLLAVVISSAIWWLWNL